MEQKTQILDLVLPCYNPIKGWKEVIVQNFNQLKNDLSHLDVHLTIVNDGSTNINDEKDVSFLKDNISGIGWIKQSPNKGKGAALRKGMQNSVADFIVFTDIDFPYKYHSTLEVCKIISSQNVDIVVGQRIKKYYKKTPWQRKVVSKLLKAFNKHILRIPVSDTQVGLKAFNRKGLEVFMKTSINRYLFDLEFLILASRKKRNLNILPVFVELRDNVVFSKLNLSILRSEIVNIVKIIFTAWMR